MFQQLSGIDAIVMYIFKSAGSNLPSEICAIIFGAPLVTMKFNRKFLLIVSSVGMIISETILGIYCILRDSGINVDSFKFIPVSTLCFFVLSFNFGMGPLCWLVSIEVYSTRIKTLAMAFSVVAYHVVGFFISQYYHSVEALIGMGPTFIIFA
ncbi:unnamed protein product [Psylliodes chrysocephalus]|uniref:Uncharacterized protein n=1 Tax=Psylliodes chrysocephalus TaxID=3402493 RepID=A0A9P0CQY7_9CUCU|nr:unnamed protein product [Psylliodes chrysocephala]